MTEHQRPPRPVAVVGPTGSGKSDAALDVAEALDGEVVNIDSMQLYRGMDIGTAKLPPGERRGIPHHQFDVLEVTATASVARYRDAAIADVEAIRARGRTPVIVGGSMMYVQALLDDWDLPPTDATVRHRWEQECRRLGVEKLHEVLAERDPDAARVIEVRDGRRTVRALEVIELTGRPFAASQPPKDRPTRWDTTIIGLSAAAEWLNPRLETRVERMFRQGLVDEVRGLQGGGLHRDSTAGQAIGYAQVLDHLAGELTLDEAVDRTVTGTRRYARRQRAWFRRDPRITWVDAAAPDAGDRVVAAALASAGTAGG
ncbi:tRNA (adenosine(37)-N6)-dimethylallyltransferase MiaA [Corynebacterium kalidii]|uniref:tRNA dimethylallyltransferase n=1 Tax=Corynebacterium kalidii TaxID=2931982 RepID=A0A9X1WI60_9CORY|nr:tRNA (adenosine(37)-N6)-dimethylallyltransferase MiaA [Corynebacterium kalidii]MCJ7859549.1 tRNA (adenosine(37)-N6)-dimethylallyltransferase MiaA [Corynebacterium kalidii]